MTDEEIVRLCSEKVMGWGIFEFETGNDSLDGLHFWGANNTDVAAMADGEIPWNPLVSDSDNAAVLDRMVELGWFYSGGFCMDPMEPHVICNNMQFFRSLPEIKVAHAQAEDRKRAIVLAALKAIEDK